MRFTVDAVVVLVVFVLVVSWAAATATGDGEVFEVDGEIGPKFTAEFVLLAVDDVFNVESMFVTNYIDSNRKKR